MELHRHISSLLTILFFVGAVGSVATVVLFVAELARTALSKDVTPEHHSSAEDQF